MRIVKNVYCIIFQESERAVTKEEGMALAQEHRCLFLECSAKTRENVQQCFNDLTLKVLLFEYMLERSWYMVILGIIYTIIENLANWLEDRPLNQILHAHWYDYFYLSESSFLVFELKLPHFYDKNLALHWSFVLKFLSQSPTSILLCSPSDKFSCSLQILEVPSLREKGSVVVKRQKQKHLYETPQSGGCCS